MSQEKHEQTPLQQILNLAKDNAKAVSKLEQHLESMDDRLTKVESRLNSIDANQADADHQIHSLKTTLQEIAQSLSDIEGKEDEIITLLSPEPAPVLGVFGFGTPTPQ